MDDSYRTKNKYKTQKGGKKRTLNTLYKEKVYKDPFAARKAADDEDRQNLKEIRAVEATQGMKMGGDAHASSCGCDSCMGESSARGAGSAIRGTGFKGVF